MGAARRLTVAAVGVVALATVGGAAFVGLRPEHVDRSGASASVRTPVPRSRPARPWPARRRPGPAAAPRPDADVAPKPAPEPILEPGDRGVQVRELQGRLSQLAWYTPPMTGRYEAATRQGVKGFQRKRGLDATGTVDPVTWRRLVRMTRMPSEDEMFNRAGPGDVRARRRGRARARHPGPAPADRLVLRRRLRPLRRPDGRGGARVPGQAARPGHRQGRPAHARPAGGDDRARRPLPSSRTSSRTPPTAAPSTRAAAPAGRCASTRPAAACAGWWTARCG